MLTRLEQFGGGGMGTRGGDSGVASDLERGSFRRAAGAGGGK